MTTTPFNRLEDLRTLYQQRKGITINRLELTGGQLYYDISIDTTSQDSSFSTFSSITWIVIMPGSLVSQNAAQVQGSTLTWTLEPRSGLVHITAQSQVLQGLSSGGTALILALMAGAAIGGGIVFMWMRRRMHTTRS